jgi:hypothetical protein
MSDEPRLIEIGVMPSGFENVHLAEGSANPLAAMVAEANAKLDAKRAAAERARAATLADIERAKATRKAKALRRFRRALKLFARG